MHAVYEASDYTAPFRSFWHIFAPFFTSTKSMPWNSRISRDYEEIIMQKIHNVQFYRTSESSSNYSYNISWWLYADESLFVWRRSLKKSFKILKGESCKLCLFVCFGKKKYSQKFDLLISYSYLVIDFCF